MKITHLLIIVILISFNLKSYSATCTAQASSNWTLASTWSCGSAPSCNDIIIIPSGFTVTINKMVDLTGGGCAGTKLNIYGVLFFSGNASRLDVVATSTINIYTGGKITTDQPGNNSQKINIGNGQAEWNSSMGPLSGPWTITNASSGSNPALPIKLINFDGKCVSDGVEINWSTATEKNNDYFIIEKSLNGLDYQDVAHIEGSGTSVTTKKYSFFDNTRNYELTYYRLSQVDYSGETTRFKVIDINCRTNSIDQMVLFPNPASTELNAILNVNNASSNNIIKIVNNFGQIVVEKTVDLTKGINTIALPIELSSGAYSIIVSSEIVNIPSQKLIIIK